LPATHRIQDAIRTCLAKCQLHETPIACVAEFIEQLRSDPTWSEFDVNQVETTVRKILARLIDPE
jgi:hypothetical protein